MDKFVQFPVELKPAQIIGFVAAVVLAVAVAKRLPVVSKLV